ncbi:Na/Pi symporter [Sulfurimonas sp.]|uniref:Na/Pi cotransporter family protein n=1 Tax=Sulfurimonas sp. TaxID=2022749 RepID=UPI0026064DC4|nr:Na/Pi symporter [Sulfurimonas sp.]
MQHYEIWIEAFSGLGLFLFGMLYLEEQIKASAGRAFKQLVKNITKTHFKSLLTGIFSTALFQSSSVVTLMALSLVGAQLMSLESSIAIILGSNLGTTITAWIVAIVGFSMNIKLISYAVIGIGGLGQVLSSDTTKWKNYFGTMVGFGLIFLGLEGMKDSFSAISQTFDIAAYSFSNPYWYAVVGLALTAVIQSSSASIAIAQSALYVNVISFEAAAAFVIGANIGTTVTALLGSIGGTPDKKRVAFAHLIFNLSTGVLALIFIQQLIYLVESLFSNINSVIQIAMLHSIFNLFGVLLWYPFIGLLTAFTQRFFKKEEEHYTHFIENVSTDIPEIAMEALEKEIPHLAGKVEEFALLAINVPPPKVLEENSAVDKLLEKFDTNFDLSYNKLYKKIRLLEGEIYHYISELTVKNNYEAYNTLLKIKTDEVNSLAIAAKTIKDMLYDLDVFYNATSLEEQKFYKNMRYQILKSVRAFHRAYAGDEDALKDMDEIYKKISEANKQSAYIIKDITNNHTIKSDILTIAINDIHAIKTFSKVLYKILKARRTKHSN